MKTVIEMAREATLLDSRDDWNSVPDEYREAINAFAELVRAEERLKCAKVCEEIYTGEEAMGDWPTPEMCAEAIRARSET